MKNQPTYITRKRQIERDWHLVNLDKQILGRSATEIAVRLIGKNKPYYTPNLDCGDYVVVINAEKVKMSGKKSDQKTYYRHSGYPGGFRAFSFKQIIEKDPRKIIIRAVRGMLPKNKLRDLRMKRLKVFVGNAHPYNKQVEKSIKL
jgi:large subunit ribosomal protein L13